MGINESKRSNKRIYQLDALRGLAAIFVVLYHYSTRIKELKIPSPNTDWNFNIGHYGVPIFFIVSGFVILMSIEKQKPTPRINSILEFTQSRAIRLFPLFWVSAILTFSTVAWFGLEGREVSTTAFLANLTMLPRFFGQPFVDGVYWSLEAEVIFYAFMALSAIAWKERKDQIILSWLVLAIALEIVQIGIPQTNFALKLARAITISEWSPFFVLGISLYYIKEKSLSKIRLTNLSIASLMILNFQETTGAILTIATAAYIYLSCIKQIDLPTPRPLVFIGNISYALYLIHQNIGYIIIRELHLRLNFGQTEAIATALIITIILSSILTFWIEKPIARLLRSKKIHVGSR